MLAGKNVLWRNEISPLILCDVLPFEINNENDLSLKLFFGLNHVAFRLAQSVKEQDRNLWVTGINLVPVYILSLNIYYKNIVL